MNSVRLLLRSLSTCLLSLACSVPVAAEVDYLRDIKPILREKCFACHGALKQESGLRLDTVAAMRRGGDGGPALDAAHPATSSLLARVTAEDPTQRMPLEATPLSEQQVSLVRQWLESGSPAPADEKPESDPRDHWAFRVPQRPALPPPTDFGELNPVDRFIHAALAREQLSPQPPADRAHLLRRVYVDLMGLPPTVDELQSFLADDRPDAYERVVDQLLERPQYAERWARHWMDVWRYADWHGRRHVPDVWNSAPQIWRWRDWIVRSLNEDKGYDQMVAQMLAADELTPGDDANTVATGYLVRNWYALNPNDWMRQNVEHTAKAFLALTFNCAHCHDHKYDPILQEDYFKLRAFFEPIGLRQDRLAGEADPGPFQEYQYSTLRKIVRTGTIRVYDKTADAPTWFYTGGDERNRDRERGSIPPGVPAIFGEQAISVEPVPLPVDGFFPGLRTDLIEALEREAEQQGSVASAKVEESRASVAAAVPTLIAAWDADPENAFARWKVESEQARVSVAEAEARSAVAARASLAARIAADRAKFSPQPGVDAAALAREAHQAESRLAEAQAEAQIADGTRQLTELESVENPTVDDARTKALAAARQRITDGYAALATARAAALDPAKANEYAALSPEFPKQSTGRRAALARWLGSRNNPLTARVAVNHIWMRHFRQPLVPTVFDFGRNGQPPSHPELLDWLAVELMESGWSTRHLHRLLVTSATYRRSSSSVNASAHVMRDPENRLLWRQNVGRLEAEVVRDALLTAGDRLDLRIGGQELENAESLTTRRRTLYYSCQPEVDGKSAFGALFDAPDAAECYRRTESIVPQQALALSNSALTHDISATVAERLSSRMAASGADAETSFVELAFQEILSRSPTAAETARCREFLQPTSDADGTVVDAAKRRAGLIRSLFNHNDFMSVR